MAFYSIDKYKVFLDQKLYDEVFEEVSSGKDAKWRISSGIQGHSELQEKMALIKGFLLQEMKLNEEAFVDKYVKFDFTDEEARRNIWTLLCDYCDCFGHSFLSSCEDDTNRVLRDYMIPSKFCPMGDIFYLSHIVKPYYWWWRYFYSMKERQIRIRMDVRRVLRIEGSLHEFTVFGENFEVNLSDAIVSLDFIN